MLTQIPTQIPNKQIAYNEVLCPYSTGCYLMEEALDEINNVMKNSMSERRKLRAFLDRFEKKYCNDKHRRENCPVLETL